MAHSATVPKVLNRRGTLNAFDSDEDSQATRPRAAVVRLASLQQDCRNRTLPGLHPAWDNYIMICDNYIMTANVLSVAMPAYEVVRVRDDRMHHASSPCTAGHAIQQCAPASHDVVWQDRRRARE